MATILFAKIWILNSGLARPFFVIRKKNINIKQSRLKTIFCSDFKWWRPHNYGLAQTLANRGPDSRLVLKGIIKALMSKSNTVGIRKPTIRKPDSF